MEPLVCIILVNYKSYKYTIDCVNSLQKINYKNKKIIIVDNCSNDNSIDELTKHCNNVEILSADKNDGWSGGNNIGINKALKEDAEYVLLLNNDTEVEPEFLNEMMKGFEDKQVGMVGSKIMYYDEPDRFWYAGGRINWFKFTSEHFGIKEKDLGQFDEKQYVTFITGCNMLIKREVFEKIGLIPEEYFMYFEDNDFCTKAIDSGFKLVYIPTAKIFHKVSASSGGEDSAFTIKWMTRNIQIFMKKYRNKSPFYLGTLVYRKLAFIKNLFKYSINGQTDKVQAVKWGINEGKRYKVK